MNSREIVICNPTRSAIGTYGGSLKDIPAPTLGAAVIREVIKRSGLDPHKVQTLVMGNVIQAGLKMNGARQAGIGAALPVTVPALAVNRVCGSGAQAMVGAALEIWAGMIDCAIGGGMENMDRAPYLLPQGRWGARMGDATLYDSMLMDGLNDAFSGPDGHPADTFYKEIEAALHNRYNITHSTIQIDHKPPGHGCAAVV